MIKNSSASAETRAKMSAAHRARWEKNKATYLEAAVRSGISRRGTKYKLPRNSVIYNQYGIRYKSIKEVCAKHGLIERLVRLVLEGKRRSTGGLEFQLVSPRYETDHNRFVAKKMEQT